MTDDEALDKVVVNIAHTISNIDRTASSWEADLATARGVLAGLRAAGWKVVPVAGPLDGPVGARNA